ncbi:hypothetical protein RF11_07841 [Thelohanellus kitauei]|uniref:Uncharacterized protein n=1 Tax=Thelohanellus kitauei TaxID=669202 RepID=A0A0C2MTB5_THEKT|nr:hypothetical protein RF11_07841 [Thelohanellus kitauei]
MVCALGQETTETNKKNSDKVITNRKFELPPSSKICKASHFKGDYSQTSLTNFWLFKGCSLLWKQALRERPTQSCNWIKPQAPLQILISHFPPWKEDLPFYLAKKNTINTEAGLIR